MVASLTNTSLCPPREIIGAGAFVGALLSLDRNWGAYQRPAVLMSSQRAAPAMQALKFTEKHFTGALPFDVAFEGPRNLIEGPDALEALVKSMEIISKTPAFLFSFFLRRYF